MQDVAYRDFNASLIPTVEKDTVIGIRVPHLRRYSAGISKEFRNEFFQALPHRYHEENNLHAFLIERIIGFVGVACDFKQRKKGKDFLFVFVAISKCAFDLFVSRPAVFDVFFRVVEKVGRGNAFALFCYAVFRD